jgi:long-subunit acyl-CoA synthetase (AMP-forming)
MMGYYKDEKLTSEFIIIDFHTGDIGNLIRMVLKNHGSKKEMFKTSGGNILHHTY